jgi:hypothetical protein
VILRESNEANARMNAKMNETLNISGVCMLNCSEPKTLNTTMWKSSQPGRDWASASLMDLHFLASSLAQRSRHSVSFIDRRYLSSSGITVGQ